MATKNPLGLYSGGIEEIPPTDKLPQSITNGIPYGVATGSANTYAVTLDPPYDQLVDGMPLSVKINVDSTAASTINPDGLGAIPINDSLGNSVTDLKANTIYTLRYESNNQVFIMQGKGGGSNGLEQFGLTTLSGVAGIANITLTPISLTAI